MSVSHAQRPVRSAKKRIARTLSAKERKEKRDRYEARIKDRLDRLAGTSPGGRVFNYSTLHLKGIMYSREHIRRRVAAGKFPPPIYLGPRNPIWREEDLDEWLAKQARKSGGKR